LSKVESIRRRLRRGERTELVEDGERRRKKREETYPTKSGSRGAKSISLLAMKGRALYPRYVVYVY
jgi:hypothetical protein